MRRPLVHVLILGAYAVLALAYTFPLLACWTNMIPGLITQDNNNPWNMWHFRYNIVSLHENPFWSDFQYWPVGANLILHHYTLFNDALAFFLLPVLGVIRTHNLIFVSLFALSGWAVYALLKDWKVPPLGAFAGGLYFAFSPALGAWMSCGAGMEYVGVWCQPLYLWALQRCIRGRSLAAAVAAAAALSVIWCYNYYYFAACAMMVPLFWIIFEKPFTLAFERRRGGGWVRALETAALLALVWVLRSLAKGQVEFHGSGSLRQLVSYVLPYCAFWSAVWLRCFFAWRPLLRWNRTAVRWQALAPYAAVGACWAALNWPLVRAVAIFMNSGDYGSPLNRWRGGGNPADLGLQLLPNSHNPLWAAPIWKLIGGDPGFANFGWAAFALVAWLFLKERPADRWVRAWGAAMAVFLVLFLGPWLKLFSVHTYMPLPFYFLHLLPVFSNFPNGFYFCIAASLFIALLVGHGVERLRLRYGKTWALAAVAILAVECGWGYGYGHLYSIDVDPIFARLRDRPYGAVLPVPVDVMFHLTVPYGYLGRAFFNNMNAQVAGEKPFVGGSLARSARRTYDVYMADRRFTGLLEAQEGAKPPRALSEPREVERFFRDWRLTYVLVDRAILPASLKETMKRWPMHEIDREGPLVLYETGR